MIKKRSIPVVWLMHNCQTIGEGVMFNPSQFNTVIHLSAHSMIPLKGNVNMWSSRTLLLNNKHGWNIKHCCSSPSRHCTLMRWHKINHHRLAILLSSAASFDFSLSSMAACVSSTITLPFCCSPLPPLTPPHPLLSPVFYPPPHCRCVVLPGRHWLFLILYGRLHLIHHLIAASLSSTAAFGFSLSLFLKQMTMSTANERYHTALPNNG